MELTELSVHYFFQNAQTSYCITVHIIYMSHKCQFTIDNYMDVTHYNNLLKLYISEAIHVSSSWLKPSYVHYPAFLSIQCDATYIILILQSPEILLNEFKILTQLINNSIQFVISIKKLSNPKNHANVIDKN